MQKDIAEGMTIMEEKNMNFFKPYIDRLKSVFVTGEEFEKMLQDIMERYQESGLFIKYVVKDKDQNEYTYGKEGPENEANNSDSSKEYEGGYKRQIYLWQKEEIVSINECRQFFDEFWNGDLCDKACGIIANNSSKFETKCNETLKVWSHEKKKIALFMIDLDKFKDVNKQHNHEIGTAVISDFSRVLRKTLEKKGILIHQSGDEFNILYCYEKPWEIVALAYELRKKINEHEFKQALDVDLTMAVGVYLLSSKQISYMDARNKAEAAYDGKEKNAEKQRDSIRIEKDEKDVTYGDSRVKDDRMLKLAIIRTVSVRDKGIFHNIFLDFISDYTSKIELNNPIEFQNEIDDIVTWINPSWKTNIRCTVLSKSWDTDISISRLEIALAVFHGALRNSQIIDKNICCNIFKEDQKSFFCIKIDENVFFKGEIDSINDLQWNSGKIKEVSFNEKRKKAVLLCAGYDNDIKIPEDIFDKIIRVDTRPALGGALQDLWTAALCELVTNMKNNSYFTDIFIMGEVKSTPKLKEYLNKINSWETGGGKYSIRYISRKTFMSESDIIDFKNKFINHIYELDERGIIDKLYELYSDYFQNEYEKTADLSESKSRILNRYLEYNNIELEIIHGCKAQSIADAFPIVLEILRSAAKRNENDYIIDQAGRRLFELMNFRILLENPKSENLPDYYKYDEDELTEYYTATFGTEKGLFRNEFMKNNQLKKTIDHVVEAINNPEKRYATRRAILVVPNEESSNRDVQYPLGLVSVWIAPRVKNGCAVIDFSYTWRTVEALVGLPESMYASVKFAEELTEEISAKCNTISAELGRISYNAYSLHMFLDRESMNIIRGIVNDASI